MTSAEADIFEAIEAEDLGRVRDLAAADPALAAARDEEGVSAVSRAAYRGRADLVDALLAANPELDVFEAATVGRLERVRELVERDPDLVSAVSADGYTPLHLAAFFGRADVARFLVERGADVNEVARNPMRVMPLHSAAAASEVEIARMLLDGGAEVNAQQERGFTPLHAAAQNGDVELTRLLLERGADPEQATEDGRRAVDFAAGGEQSEVLALLGER